MYRNNYTNTNKNIVFKQWKRASYAAFASLGRVIKISVLSASISNWIGFECTAFSNLEDNQEPTASQLHERDLMDIVSDSIDHLIIESTSNKVAQAIAAQNDIIFYNYRRPALISLQGFFILNKHKIW